MERGELYGARGRAVGAYAHRKPLAFCSMRHMICKPTIHQYGSVTFSRSATRFWCSLVTFLLRIAVSVSGRHLYNDPTLTPSAPPSAHSLLSILSSQTSVQESCAVACRFVCRTPTPFYIQPSSSLNHVLRLFIQPCIAFPEPYEGEPFSK